MPVGCDRIRSDIAGQDHLETGTVKTKAQTAGTREKIYGQRF
jgi:hypothetical protein